MKIRLKRRNSNSILEFYAPPTRNCIKSFESRPEELVGCVSVSPKIFCKSIR